VTLKTLLSRLILPTMAAALGAYVCVHSPLVISLAGMFGRVWTSPYFVSSQGILLGSAIASVAATTAIIAALAAADVVTRSGAGATYERPLAYAVTAFAFVVIPAAFVGAVAGWTGTALLRPPLGPLIVATPALAVMAIGFRRGWRPGPVRVAFEVRSGLRLVLTALAAVLLGISAILGLVRPPTGFDALSYHAPLAVYFWQDGNIVSLFDRAPGGWAIAQPGAAELWFGLLLSGFGERVANLGQLPFALLGAAAVRAFSRRLGFRHGAASVAGLSFLLAPLVVIPAGIQVSDIMAAALLMSGIALASGPVTSETPYRAAMIGLAAGLAVTAKLAVLPAAAALIAFVAITSNRASFIRRGNGVRVCLALAVAFGVAVAPWAVRNIVLFGNPTYPAALPFLGRGVVVGDFEKKDTRFVPTAAAWPLYPLVESHSDESGLGALFLVAAAPGLLMAVSRRRSRPVWLYAAVSVTSLAAWWKLTQHEPRHLLTMLGLTFGFLPWMLLLMRRHMRNKGAVLLAVAAVFSAIVTLDQGLLPRVGQPVDRLQFYDEVWGVDSFVAGWNAREPLLYNTGYASLSYAGDYPLLGPALARVLLTVDTDASTQSIVSLMKRHGARYAYVPASPTFQSEVEGKYASDLFEVAHVSTVATGKRAGTKRYLFRLREGLSVDGSEAAPVEGVRH
jgi:hypothetical protein